MDEPVEAITTTIVETDKFTGTASVGDEVHLYRRLADRYDKTAIAMLNDKDEIVGYLNREVALHKILPYLKRGYNFQCSVTGPPNGTKSLPIDIHIRLSEQSREMIDAANPVSSLRGVGSVAEGNFKAIGISTAAQLITRVESTSVHTICAEIKQENPSARLSIKAIENIYQRAKEQYVPI